MSRLFKSLLFHFLAAGCFAQVVVTNEKDLGGNGLNLREAVENAASGETITFSEDLSSKIIEITKGEIVIDKSLVIEGPGAEDLILIEGNSLTRLFRVEEGALLTLRNLHLSKGGAPAEYGGGILNDGTLSVEDCRFTNCRAASGGALSNEGELTCLRSRFEGNEVTSPVSLELGGGAILSSGTTTVSHCEFVGNIGSGNLFGGGAIHSRKTHLNIFECVFRENQVEGNGGAVLNSGILEVNRSTFDDNYSSDDGAAIFNEANLTAEPVEMTARSSTFSSNRSDSDSGALHLSRNSEGYLENCTIAQNSAQDAGGAIENSQGVLTLSACTIANNHALRRGGAIYNLGHTSLKNSILSGNSTGAGPNDLQLSSFPQSVYIPIGANIIEAPSNSRVSFNTNSDDGPDLILPGPALLLPLDEYGGITQTMPPQLDSPALNTAIGSTLNKDQRGSTRFVDPDPDIGSVEFLGVNNETFFDSDLDGLSNGIEIVTGTDPLAHDPEHPGHLRIKFIAGSPVLSFGYVRSTSNRHVLRLFRSTDLRQEVEILSSLTTIIPNSVVSPYQFTDETAPDGDAFYRLEVTRR